MLCSLAKNLHRENCIKFRRNNSNIVLQLFLWLFSIISVWDLHIKRIYNNYGSGKKHTTEYDFWKFPGWNMCLKYYDNCISLRSSALVAWVDEWQLSISVNKCCVLHIGKITVMNQFHINDIPLPLVSSYRDLGITVSKDLSPTVYINEIVPKAHQRANMIHRCFVSQNVELLTRAFVTLCTTSARV